MDSRIVVTNNLSQSKKNKYYSKTRLSKSKSQLDDIDLGSTIGDIYRRSKTKSANALKKRKTNNTSKIKSASNFNTSNRDNLKEKNNTMARIVTLSKGKDSKIIRPNKIKKNTLNTNNIRKYNQSYLKPNPKIISPQRKERQPALNEARQSPHKSPPRTACQSPQRAPQKTARQSPHKSPPRTACQSPQRATQKTARQSPQRAPQKTARQSPQRAPPKSEKKELQKSPHRTARQSPKGPAHQLSKNLVGQSPRKITSKLNYKKPCPKIIQKQKNEYRKITIKTNLESFREVENLIDINIFNIDFENKDKFQQFTNAEDIYLMRLISGGLDISKYDN